MKTHRIRHIGGTINISQILLTALTTTLSIGTSLLAVELPSELPLWEKDHNVTSLVLKYRTRPAEIGSREAWQNYQGAVQADGRQAIRILRKNADDLGLDPNKIGICGFSAGGHLAISCALLGEPKSPETKTGKLPRCR